MRAKFIAVALVSLWTFQLTLVSGQVSLLTVTQQSPDYAEEETRKVIVCSGTYVIGVPRLHMALFDWTVATWVRQSSRNLSTGARIIPITKQFISVNYVIERRCTYLIFW